MSYLAAHVHAGEGAMYRSFQYLRPDSPEEACELKARNGRQAHFWAGGTDLLLEWRRGAVEIEYCIDLSYLSELRAIRLYDREIEIGALATIAALQECRGFDKSHAVLHDVASQFATPQIRNIATIGGNLCHAAPSADFAVALIALGAEMKLLGRKGERTLPIDAFFTGVKRTAMQADELLVEIRVPQAPARSACTFTRVTRSSVDIALVNSAVHLMVDEAGIIRQARIALGAVAPVPFRSKAAEEMLLNRRFDEVDDEALERVGERAAADARPITDLRASAAYRRYVCDVLVKRALRRALCELQEG
jgi:probable selenate reductase FAD-binding subunit